MEKKKNEKNIEIFQKIYMLTKYLVIRLLKQFNMIIFRTKNDKDIDKGKDDYKIDM